MIWFGLLCAVGGAVFILGLGFLATLLDSSGAASQPRKQAPAESSVALARIEGLEAQIKEQNELIAYLSTERKVIALVIAGAAAQRAKYGQPDYDALAPIVAKYAIRHAPVAASERFEQVKARSWSLQTIAAIAAKQGVLEDATKIIIDVFGADQAAWSPAERDLFAEWQRCFQHADEEIV